MAAVKAEFPIEQVVKMLDKVPLFEGLPTSDLERIAALVRGREVAEGEQLFREGDAGDRFYIVHSGAVEILKERPRGDHERLAVKRAGEAFGEMALLTDAPRSATVRALEATRLLSVSRAQFDELLGGEGLAVRLMKGLARALRALDVRFAAREAGGGGDALKGFNRYLQKGLLPRAAPGVDGYDVGGGCAVDEGDVSQSLWDAIELPGNAKLLAVFDVKGETLPPAHLLAVARALLREIAEREESLEAILTRLNEAVARSLFEGLDLCVQVRLAHITPAGLRCAAAAEDPILVVRAGGDVEEMAPDGPPLGILPSFDYGATAVTCQPGDTLLLLSEADRRLARGAADLLARSAKTPAAETAGALQGALLRAAEARQGKDICFILARKK
ncbi:MAG: cyclic nucleotide-binding domain-containing protein [Gemmatimonadota bacterium]